MAKELSTDFTTEMAEEQNRPFVLVEFFLGDDEGVWRLTSLDERLEIEFSGNENLKEP